MMKKSIIRNILDTGYDKNSWKFNDDSVDITQVFLKFVFLCEMGI